MPGSQIELEEGGLRAHRYRLPLATVAALLALSAAALASTGALTPKGCIADPEHNLAGCARTAAGLDEVYSLAISPDGRSVYAVSDGSRYGGDAAIVRFARNPTTGALTPQGCIA